MRLRIAEIIGSVIIVGALILLGLGKVSFGQAITLIAIGILLIAIFQFYHRSSAKVGRTGSSLAR